MDTNYFISIVLDKRKKSKESDSGKNELKDIEFPVKLRVFTSSPRIQKLYPLNIKMTDEEFKKVWKDKSSQREYKQKRLRLQAIEMEANEVAEKLTPFTIEAFEKKMFATATGKQDVTSLYDQIIKQLKENNQISTASTYELAQQSLSDYYGKEKIPFHVITPKWLRGYEKHMIDDNKRSQTTVSIYLRTLRSVFNHAIADNIIARDYYPFGKRRYEIPNPKAVKKALTKDQMSKLFHATPATPEQSRAKDFWFFSYMCNGMNFKDIANLKYKDISGDKLIFRRAKTAHSNTNQAPVTVFLSEHAQEIIKKHGDPDIKPDNHIFKIIDPKATAAEKHRQIKNFVRYVNQHFSKFAKANGIEENVSTYWARHSFATNAIRSGASMEYVSEALSHSSLNTTKSYFAGFEDEKKKEIAKKLMEF